MPNAVPPGSRVRSRRVAVRTALPLAVACAVLTVLVVVRWAPLAELDAGWAQSAHRRALAAPELTRVSRVLSDWVWDPWTMRALAAVAVGWLLLHDAGRAALWLVVTCGGGTLVAHAAKFAVNRPRPEWRRPVDTASYAAFPSGHAMTAAVVCGALLWLWHLRRGRGLWWWLALAGGVVSTVGVGLTRVWLGVHWSSDVLAGWLCGALTVAVAVALAPDTARRPEARRRPHARGRTAA